jgi:hypothetical protein
MDLKMNPITDNLIRQLSADDEKIRSDAILYLVYILEQNNLRLNLGEYDRQQQELPPNLCDVKLSDNDQQEIAIKLSEIITASENKIGLFWVLGKIRPKVAVMPTVKILQTEGYPTSQRIKHCMSWIILFSIANQMRVIIKL